MTPKPSALEQPPVDAQVKALGLDGPVDRSIETHITHLAQMACEDDAYLEADNLLECAEVFGS